MKTEESPLDLKTIMLDVKLVSQIIVRVSKAKSPRTVKDAMTVSELRALCDAALVGIRSIPATRKPNGLTDEGAVIAQLEADIAHITARLETALAELDEAKEKLGSESEER